MSESEKRTLSFGITGEFITKVAREWFFIENKPYSLVEELLTSCMGGTDIPEGELKFMAQDVILGRAEFRGNSWDGTFDYVKLGSPAALNIFDEFCKIRLEMERIKEESSKTAKRYCTMFDALRLWLEDDIESAVEECADDPELNDVLLKLLSMYSEVKIAYGPGGYKKVYFDKEDDPVEVAPAPTGESLVDDYFAQRNIEEKHSDNYGWLEPDGTFHPVPWCEHQEWATEALQERGLWDDFRHWDGGLRDLPGDYLTTVKGWVLLHNPGQGVAYVSRNTEKRLTKAQREFLFDYFYKRGRKAEAVEYLEED